MKIRVSALAAIAAAVLTISSGAAQTSDDLLYRVRIGTSSISQTKAGLGAGGYDVIASDAERGTIDLAVTGSEWRRLEASGYDVTLVDRGRPLREVLAAPRSTTHDAVPASYRDLQGIIDRMQQIAVAFPAIARVVDLTATYNTPPTFEGRHLLALKISDNVNQDEDEPAVLIVSAHHAREISTPVITLAAADRLTTQYATDPRIAAAVNGHEIWIAPVWNPHGYNHVFTTDNLWRKNRRVLAGGVGVDLNRNYSQGWNASCAGSTSVTSETYKGPSAASEPETQTLITWSQRERFAKVIDYHSYGREVLYSYLCLSHPFTSWMQQEAAALSQASGYGGLTRLPSAEGEHPEWQLAKMGAYAFLIETHTQFQPSYTSAVNEANLVWPGILSVLERPVSVSGHVTDAGTGAPLAATIELPNVTFANGESNASGGSYGAFHMFLPPGTYDVRFSAPGYVPAVRQVTVSTTSAVVANVQLTSATLPPSAPQNLRIIR
jgi:Zinc carboxypeptidase/Carboxypeptidase regulatory-like domain